MKREKKCNAMNSIRRLSVYHEDLVVNNIHSIVLALLQEVIILSFYLFMHDLNEYNLYFNNKRSKTFAHKFLVLL